MCSICIPGSTVYYLIDGAYKLNVAQYTTCNMDEEQFMNIIKGALHILIIKPPCLTAPVRTSAGAGRGVEVVLMGAAVVLAFSEQQHLGRVTAGRTNPGRLARQALAVACCRE